MSDFNRAYVSADFRYFSSGPFEPFVTKSWSSFPAQSTGKKTLDYELKLIANIDQMLQENEADYVSIIIVLYNDEETIDTYEMQRYTADTYATGTDGKKSAIHHQIQAQTYLRAIINQLI
jgi:hypothetical protein